MSEPRRKEMKATMRTVGSVNVMEEVLELAAKREAKDVDGMSWLLRGATGAVPGRGTLFEFGETAGVESRPRLKKLRRGVRGLENLRWAREIGA